MKKALLGICASFWVMVSGIPSPAQTTDVYQQPIQVERGRDFDPLHYRIGLRFDEERQAFQGITTVTLMPFRDGFDRCTLDAATFRVLSVADKNSRALDFEQTEGQLVVHLSRLFKRGESLFFAVTYTAENLGDPRGRRPGMRIQRSGPRPYGHWEI